MKLTKIIACLSCCVALCVPSAFAVDDTEWVEADINFTTVLTGRNGLTVYGTEDMYSLDEDGKSDFLRTNEDIHYYPFASRTLSLTPSASGASFQANDISEVTGYMPSNHYESDQSSYYNYYAYNLYTLGSGGAWFWSDFYLDPGFYEVDTSFYAELGIKKPEQSIYYRPVIFEVGFENQGNMVKIQHGYSSSAKTYFEITERSRLYIAITTSSISEPYHVGRDNDPIFSLLYRVHKPTFKYRTIDAVDLVALEEANTNAGDTINDHTQVEQEWTGSMVDNFNALHLDGFTFGDGLISGFGLVSDLFMRIWNGLGSYAVVYTFPLYLGVVLLVIGRISKFSGSQGSSNKRGDGDA